MNSKTRDRQIILLLTILCLTLYFVMKNYAVKSSINRISTYKAEIARIKSDYAKNLKKINLLERKYSEYYYKSEKLKKLSKASTAYSPGKDLTDLVIKCARESGINFYTIKFSDEIGASQGELSLEFTSNYFVFLDFLSRLQDLSRDLNIKNSWVTRSSDNVRVRMELHFNSI